MNGALDALLVAVVLGASLGYAILTLGPRAWRRSLAQGLLKGLARAPRAFRHQRLLTRLGRVGAASACGGCDSCGDTANSAPESREVKVPLASIGRRR